MYTRPIWNNSTSQHKATSKKLPSMKYHPGKQTRTLSYSDFEKKNTKLKLIFLWLPLIITLILFINSLFFIIINLKVVPNPIFAFIHSFVYWDMSFPGDFSMSFADRFVLFMDSVDTVGSLDNTDNGEGTSANTKDEKDDDAKSSKSSSSESSNDSTTDPNSTSYNPIAHFNQLCERLVEVKEYTEDTVLEERFPRRFYEYCSEQEWLEDQIEELIEQYGPSTFGIVETEVEADFEDEGFEE